jgi:iron complex outermembrane receptor protein
MMTGLPISFRGRSLMASLLAAFLSMQTASAEDAAPDASQSAMAVEDTSAAVQAPAAETAAPALVEAKPAATVAAKAAPSPIAGVSELPKMSIRGKKAPPGQTQEPLLKLNTSLRETPRSLTVMNSERIKEQNFTNANSTFNYTPGVFANSYAQGGYHFYSRGQRMAQNDNRVDGFAGIAGGGDFSPSLFGVEQTVMMRGPASLLYGAAGAPGGIVNLITKKPQAAKSTEVSLRMGPYGGSSVGFNDGSSYGADIDATGPLSEDGRVLYRAQGTIENQRHFTADVMDRNRYVNLALTYKMDAEGLYLLTPILQTTRHQRPAGRASVISPTSSLSLTDGKSGINFDDMSPLDVNLSSGGRLDETFLAGADFKAKPSSAVQVNAAYRYFTYDTDVNQWAPNTATLLQTNPGDSKSWTVQRRQTKSLTERFNHGFDINSSYDHRPENASWKNLTQLGFNARITGTDRSASSATGPNQSAINIYTGATSAPLRDSNLALVETFNNTSYQWNTYLQNQTSLVDNMFVLTVGLGYMQEHLDRDYSRTTTAPVANLADVLATRYGRPTPNIALLYNVNPKLGFYTSYSTSYTLIGGEVEDRNGETGNFDPTVGENYEVGAKYDMPELSASFTSAVFYAESRNNLLTTTGNDRNPKGNNYSVQLDGEGRRSTGIEFSAEVMPIRSLRLVGGGAYIDVVNQSTVDKVADGSQGDKTPEWSFNGFSRYDIAEGPLKGLGASLGMIYQGDRLSALKTAAAPDPLIMPWFTRVDAGLYFRVNNSLDFALNVENLANDERIVYGGSTGSAIEVGSPRRATFRTSYRM